MDRLIRELIETRREANVQEVTMIRERISTADFPTGESHLAKRVFRDLQWAEGTTIEEYLDDLRRLVLQAQSLLGVYRRRGGAMVVVIGDTLVTVAPGRLGRRWERLLLVLYSADRGIIVTGYQFSDLSKVAIPGDMQWLR